METHKQFFLCKRTPCLQRQCVTCVIKAATEQLAIFRKVCTSYYVHRKTSFMFWQVPDFLTNMYGTYTTMHPSTHLILTYLPVPISPSVSLSIDLSVYIYVSASLYTSVCLCLSVRLSSYVYLYISVSLCLCMCA
jgi:hypothetical protein